MSVIATIEIASGSFDLGQVFAGIDARIELTQFVPIGESPLPFCWVDTEAIEDCERFERRVEDDPRVAAFDRLEAKADGTLYQLVWTAAVDGFFDALMACDLFVERGISQADTDAWIFRLRAFEHESLTRFQHRCDEEGIEFDVRRVAHDPTSEGSPYGLTDKQREALVLAFEAGYFAVPREISLSELADHLDISRQAYTRRLNRALENYLEATGIADLEGPERPPETGEQ